MPRRRPSDVRAGIPVRSRDHRRLYPAIDRLSGACTADIRRLDRSHYWPEATAGSFWHWAALAHGPLRRLAAPHTGTRCETLECGCDPSLHRDHLEEVLHALPKKSARELRQLVRALDSKILARARVSPAGSPDDRWWPGQL
ncbi:hypothetical protein OG625_18230 [Streptomyces sp. NBC_01351]|uniref:hypothetical protein n=1 Tax=Streptomyces sp. NBC_01351 TaxID=2903833 RepID=UPI002E33102C|nr:hypothetical protein [Streptomyces sp. NBC_01351]